MDNKQEAGYIDYIVNKKFDPSNIDWNFITEKSKEEIESQVEPIETFLLNHIDFDNYTSEQKDEFYETVVSMHEKFKESVKDAECKLKLSGHEFKFIKDCIEVHTDYDASTVFVGIHLKGTFLNKVVYDKSKHDNDILIGMPNSIVLYDIISKSKVKGLKEQTYIFAKILKALAECSKIYTHYDTVTNNLWQKIRDWNMGLSNDDKEMIKSAMLKEAMENATEQMVEQQDASQSQTNTI